MNSAARKEVLHHTASSQTFKGSHAASSSYPMLTNATPHFSGASILDSILVCGIEKGWTSPLPPLAGTCNIKQKAEARFLRLARKLVEVQFLANHKYTMEFF